MTIHEPYTFAPELESIASAWELYESVCTNMGSTHEERRTQPCMRCHDCDCIVYPPDSDGTMVHLISHHGWRMDGSRDPDHSNIVLGED